MNFLFKKDIKKMNYLAVILLTFVLASMPIHGIAATVTASVVVDTAGGG